MGCAGECTGLWDSEAVRMEGSFRGKRKDILE